MAVKLITNRPQKARICRIQYPESQHVLSGWELPPNIPGYQWVVHQSVDTVGRGRFYLVSVRLKVSQGSIAMRDAAVQIMFLLTTWRAIETLVPADMLTGHGLALGLLIIYEAAIRSELLIVRGPSTNCWCYVETEIREEIQKGWA